MATPRPDDEAPAGENLDLGVVGEAPVSGGASGGGSGEGRGERGARMSRRGLLLTAGAVLAAGALAVRHSSGAVPFGSQSPGQTPGPVTVGHFARPLDGAAPAWQLFALGADVLLRIRLATGLVTRTRVLPVGQGQVSLVPVRGRALIRAVAGGVGYEVPDDALPVRMPPALSGFGSVLPGPDLGHVWTISDRNQTRMALVPIDGGAPAATVAVPEFATTGPITDGAGGLLFEGVGGLFRVSPAGRVRTSNAIILAVGAGALLLLQRDTRGRWRTVLTSRDGGERAVPIAIGPQLPHGVLSPDGRTVVLYVVREVVRSAASLSLALVGLASGSVNELDLDITGVAGDGTVIWSPDSRRLFCVDATGRVRVVDAVTGAVSVLAQDLPGVGQLAIRTS